MSLKFKIKRTGNQLEKLTNQIRSLASENVQIGHFASQGRHYSGFTYPELMAFHHNGGNPITGEILPPRPVLDILAFRNQKLQDPVIKAAFRAWGNRKSSPQSDFALLTQLGEIMRDREKKIFGSSALARNKTPPKNINNPLIVTGDLQSKTAYKTSVDNQVKE